MGLSALEEIKGTLDQVCQAIVSVLGVDITIVDETFRRISGTGRYADSIGQQLLGTGVFEHAYRTGRSKVVENPREHEICLPCGYKEHCREFAQVCCPIIMEGQVLGVMGLAAFDMAQKARLLSNKESMLGFVENMAGLIVSKLMAHQETKKVSLLASELRLVFDAMENAILTVDLKGRVLRTNRLADELLSLPLLRRHGDGSLVDALGEPLYLHHIKPLAEAISIESIGASGGMLFNIAFVYGSGKTPSRGLLSVKPVMLKGSVSGYLITLTRNHQILGVVNAVSGGQIPTRFEDILGECEGFRAVKRYAATVAAGGSTVLIQGETGTGKELFARAIHNASPRGEGPFVAINCAAIPESLIESELFGYEDGAFTGARRGGRLGRFELADKGTIFLDEIGDMPLALQTKLLRVLQEGIVERIGSVKALPVDVRVIAATHKDLEAMVAERAFREDLYYRLNVIPLQLPPLRARRSDIVLLAERFLVKFANKLGKHFEGYQPGVLTQLLSYHWPGNIRELENTVEFMVNVSPGPWIQEGDLPRRLREGVASGPSPEAHVVRNLAAVEREEILRAVATCPSLEQAAVALGIGRATLFRKLKQYNETPVS